MIETRLLQYFLTVTEERSITRAAEVLHISQPTLSKQLIELETIEGAVRFTGNDLHVKRLTLERGEVELEGRVQEIIYHESRKGKTAGGVLSRLFR